ncbi:hypothetical protein J23TS9_06170 [Paenibacillus sp. J23TS9]|uniref:hypothetical protein n=1 Tax=Paenibacillus sp. J23TS9 TaxID=2807193 RepID=UPI001B040AD4|nr:hypothetical protein [Paenibacillus sp. J23TS9]GIP25487.1 hypothetical protein J23TS9_06170 [Paenibacillus sp. J23TS9]
MLKKISLTTFSAIMLIFGVALTVHLSADDPSIGIPSSPTSSTSEEAPANLGATDFEISDPKLRTVENSDQDPDISPKVDFETLRYTSRISTTYGDFVRQDKQIISNESEIARELRQVGPDTKQLILNFGTFLRNDYSK